MHGTLGHAPVVGHAIEDREDHRLEHRARRVRPDAPVHAEAEAEVPVSLPVEDEVVGIGEEAGSRLAIAHDNQSRCPPSRSTVPPTVMSAEMVRASPGAGVKKRKNSSVAALSNVAR